MCLNRVWVLRSIGVLCLLVSLCESGRGAPFDLAGPSLKVTVTRGSITLPVAEVPNLATGDRIWIRAVFPASQSAHYLLVSAFLSGSTNPPPESWFTKCKTWKPNCAADGLSVTVAPGAQQLVVFLAPETGGDFTTLMSAVRGRPGALVRTSQDLNQAMLDRSRLERYVVSIRALKDAPPRRSPRPYRSSLGALPLRSTRDASTASPSC